MPAQHQVWENSTVATARPVGVDLGVNRTHLLI
jgi:hypothetical protein